MRRCVWAWCLAAAALAFSPGAARAEPQARVAVREFSGPGAARVRRAMVATLQRSRRFALVANEEVERAAERLEADLAATEGRAAVGRELELAATVVYLDSDAAGYVTGQTLPVDGGMTIS